MTSLGITDDQIVDAIIKAEDDPLHPGAVTNDPSDSGGRTQYGISEHAHPEAWADGEVTIPEARSIYKTIYILKEHFDKIPDPWLKHQVVDFGVPAGEDTATRLLQQVLGTKVDGELGPKTLEKINNYPSGKLFGVTVPGFVLLNLAFRDARIMHHASVAKRRPKDLRFLLGWLRRALEFK